MSTSPASSAATRAGPDLIGLNVTFSQIGLSPQKSSLRVMTIRSAGTYSENLNGPVPIAAVPALNCSVVAPHCPSEMIGNVETSFAISG